MFLWIFFWPWPPVPIFFDIKKNRKNVSCVWISSCLLVHFRTSSWLLATFQNVSFHSAYTNSHSHMYRKQEQDRLQLHQFALIYLANWTWPLPCTECVCHAECVISLIMTRRDNRELVTERVCVWVHLKQRQRASERASERARENISASLHHLSYSRCRFLFYYITYYTIRVLD